MYKSKETRKALLDIVAMHDPDRVKQLLALMQPILSCPGMSTSKSCSRIREITKIARVLRKKYTSQQRLI